MLLILGRALGVAGILAALAGLYVSLVIAQPQGGGQEAAATQPPLDPSPALRAATEADLPGLVETFPAPVMSFMSGSGMTFVSGTSADSAWQGRFGRVLTLYWQTREGVPLILQSIYPAEALDLMGRGDYTFSAKAGPTLFGMSSVRMENAENLRIHVQAEGQGLYVLTAPRSLASSLSEICRSIQLFTVSGEE